MKKLTLGILILSLAGCRSAEVAIVCSAVENNSLGVHEMCSYSYQFDSCYCKQVDMDTFTDLTKLKEVPLERCDGVSGLSSDSWASVGPKLKALNRLKVERCGQ